MGKLSNFDIISRFLTTTLKISREFKLLTDKVYLGN